MLEAANALEFERAALLRDQLRKLQEGAETDAGRANRWTRRKAGC